MMSFCKNTLHSLLGLTMPIHLDSKQPSSSSSVSSVSTSIGLVTATDHSFKKLPYVLESATVKSSPPPPFKKDPGGIGFIDDIGGGVNGLMSCTESLGFESCDERRVDDEIELLCSSEVKTTSSRINNWRSYERRKEVKQFPPPLSSFNHNGKLSFFLRPVRRDGRLELTEVRIDRPEILRASREDGRLRLHLIIEQEEDEEEEEEEFDDINEETHIEEEEKEEEEEEEEQEQEQEEEDEEKRSEEWKFPVTGEGFGRCHEVLNHRHDYHYHNLNVWRQHCVTTS